MRTAFPDFYRPTPEELEARWDDAWFAVDANILLNLYRYSTPTRNKLFELLGKIEERLWLPHQAGLEFHRNRLTVICKQAKVSEELARQINKAVDALKQENNAHFLPPNFYDDVAKSVAPWTARLRELGQESAKLLHDDPILTRISELFKSKVGPAPAADVLEGWYKLGATRYQAKKPPGYADEKPEPDRYGDLVLWRELIAEAAQRKKAVFLITDDKKEDWWEAADYKQQILGPCRELGAEMRAEAKVDFWLYDCKRFMEHAGKKWQEPVADDTLQEVSAVSAQQVLVGPPELSAFSVDSAGNVSLGQPGQAARAALGALLRPPPVPRGQGKLLSQPIDYRSLDEWTAQVLDAM